MTKSKIIFFLQMFCAIVAPGILSGCGTMGGTNILSVEVKPSQRLQSRLEVGSVVLDENAKRVDSFGVFRWGEFSQEDLRNVELSIKGTLASMQAGSPALSDKRITLHVLLRRYMVSASNNSVGVLANVAWCAVNESGRIVFHEQFYASDSVVVVGTIGGAKDKVNEAILLRIATMSAYLASSDMHKAKPPVTPPNAYLQFEQAVQRLPASFRSTHIATGGGYSYTYEVGGTANWNWASSPDRVNWEERLRHAKLPQSQ